MTQTHIFMEALASAIRNEANLDAHCHYGKQVTFTLPGSGDVVTLWPAPSRPSHPASLFWTRSTSAGRTVRGGEFDWGSDTKPFVDWASGLDYSLSEITSQYAPVLDSLTERGMNARIVHVDGIGFLIRIDLPDSTYVRIGGEEGLPSRAERIEQWHVQHHGISDHIAVIYHASDSQKMVEATVRYIRGTLTRYGGYHPLGAPVPGESPDGPDNLYGLISDLSGLRRFNPGTPGGALVTIADADGSNGASIAVPAEAVARISRLLAVELKVIDAYGG